MEHLDNNLVDPGTSGTHLKMPVAVAAKGKSAALRCAACFCELLKLHWQREGAFALPVCQFPLICQVWNVDRHGAQVSWPGAQVLSICLPCRGAAEAVGHLTCGGDNTYAAVSPCFILQANPRNTYSIFQIILYCFDYTFQIANRSPCSFVLRPTSHSDALTQEPPHSLFQSATPVRNRICLLRPRALENRDPIQPRCLLLTIPLFQPA